MRFYVLSNSLIEIMYGRNFISQIKEVKKESFVRITYRILLQDTTIFVGQKSYVISLN